MSIIIKRPDLHVLTIRIMGTSPLICHAWSKKAKEEMLAKQMGKNVGPRAKKDPKKDYEESLYPTSDKKGYGFPAVAFKSAAVRAAKLVDGLAMTDVRQMIHVIADDGDLVRIKGKPSPREDMVRLSKGVADIRYRGEFRKWETTLRIQYNQDVISADQIANLIYLAGFSVGVGEWRVDKNGTFGMFTIDDESMTIERVAA